MKPGYLTTEFWSTAFIHLLSAISMLSAAQGWAFDDSKYSSLVPVAAIIASGIAQAYYSHSRGNVKAAPTPNTETTTDAPLDGPQD